jgi:Uma2 family endonuclease
VELVAAVAGLCYKQWLRYWRDEEGVMSSVAEEVWERVAEPVRQPAVPLLENGDRLTRVEFERRYQALPSVKKAELIEGEVYMSSPVRFKQHAKPHAQIMAWLTAYWVATPVVQLADNATLRLDLDNEVQPDVLLFIEPEVGGRVKIGEDDYLAGAPELIVEIAASSVATDLNKKKTVYRRNGIQEYLVWQIYERRVDWFVLDEEVYVALQPDAQGVLSSRVFSGLRLAVPALLAGDLAAVLEEVKRGLAMPEHAEFVGHRSFPL